MQSQLVRTFGAALLAAFLASCGAPIPLPDVPNDLEPSKAATSHEVSLMRGENLRPGTTEWRLSDPARNREIEGYASKTSLDRGDSIDFFVSSADATFRAEIFRMGWYGGSGGRLMRPAEMLQAQAQGDCPVVMRFHMVACTWKSSFSLAIPASKDHSEWMSGYYLVKLTGMASGKQSYIPFVVRDDARASDLLMQASVTTYQAYNKWGGYSLYSKPRGFKVSFNRPYQQGDGSGEFFFWEYSMARFLEREGYDVTYQTDIDTHMHRPSSDHKALLIVGHDEYWSWQMREHVQMARDAGMHLGVFAANVGYWQVRFEDDAQGRPNRVQVCYKPPKPRRDPFSRHSDATRYFTTTQFRKGPVRRPEAELIGVMYAMGSDADGPLKVEDNSSWVFENTGFRNGDQIPGIVGYETDQIYPSSPTNVHRVAHTEFADKKKKFAADTVYYEANSGAVVFATGSMQWNWALDQLGEDIPYHSNRSNAGIMQATRNVLKKFGAAAH